VTFGTGEVDITRHNKMTYGHNETNFGTDRGDFLGQEKLVLSLFKMNYGT
jgi:hypothetical protein